MDVGSKLQIKPGQSVAVLNAPPGLVLPGVSVAAARADRLPWIGYPKGGQLGTDLNRDRLAAALALRGVQPVRQVSIDDTWSALRFRPANQ
jgi:hypothetical protein